MENTSLIALERAIAEQFGNLTGLVVVKGGETVYEKHFNGYAASDALHVFSVTKSVISALIGIALGDGLIESVKQRVLDFFPGYSVKRGEKTIQNVTLEDMLTMCAPYKYKSAPYTKYFTSESWVRAALDLLGGKGQIGEFRYAPLIGPDILSGILESATGRSVCDFANERLFAPLGIAPRHSYTFKDKDEQLAWYKKRSGDGEWIADPLGVNTAGWGLTLTANEMAKIGALYLARGELGAKRIISQNWVESSTSEHSRWGELAYGYLWWVIDESERCYAALGDGGNAIYVSEKKKLVVSMLSSFKPRPADRVEFIKKYIEPLFCGA